MTIQSTKISAANAAFLRKVLEDSFTEGSFQSSKLVSVIFIWFDLCVFFCCNRKANCVTEKKKKKLEGKKKLYNRQKQFTWLWENIKTRLGRIMSLSSNLLFLLAPRNSAKLPHTIFRFTQTSIFFILYFFFCFRHFYRENCFLEKFIAVTIHFIILNNPGESFKYLFSWVRYVRR